MFHDTNQPLDVKILLIVLIKTWESLSECCRSTQLKWHPRSTDVSVVGSPSRIWHDTGPIHPNKDYFTTDNNSRVPRLPLYCYLLTRQRLELERIQEESCWYEHSLVLNLNFMCVCQASKGQATSSFHGGLQEASDRLVLHWPRGSRTDNCWAVARLEPICWHQIICLSKVARMIAPIPMTPKQNLRF